uniref:Ig-like domain-containing protein n=1 Tax=Oncorhynchus kisutch TaxID=8019 RepID=A0A8C7I6J5_ONCKI
MYWCESGSGEHSNAVNITVHAGAVILERPVHILYTAGAVILERPVYILYTAGAVILERPVYILYTAGAVILERPVHILYTAGAVILERPVYILYTAGAVILERPVYILYTAGAVILESPALPVTKGDSVTRRCRYQGTPSNLTADFYKDESLIRNATTGEMTIPAVSKSDEGLYKCTNSEGESPESWMTVTGENMRNLDIQMIWFFFTLLRGVETCIINWVVLLYTVKRC